jgi:hypothetical protein
VESITGVDRCEVERAARLLWESRPLAYYEIRSAKHPGDQ